MHKIPYNLARIHPFDDGNGRCARILMNLILIRILIKKHHVPAAIVEKKQSNLTLILLKERTDLV